MAGQSKATALESWSLETPLGATVGLFDVGAFDGWPVEGDCVGIVVVGEPLGATVGLSDVGAFDGWPVEGDCVGVVVVGTPLGEAVGFSVVGAQLGAVEVGE